MNSTLSKSQISLSIKRFEGNTTSIQQDAVSIEEPLELQLSYQENEISIQRNISITMRTPGNDIYLALGFLFTENIIQSITHIETIKSIDDHRIWVALRKGIVPNIQSLERNFYTTSSCGVCGKSSLEAIQTISQFSHSPKPPISIALQTLYKLPTELRNAQKEFNSTGGIHACALFSPQGEMQYIQEDVGRHNALDKCIGEAFHAENIPLHQSILILSGRISFELVQKAAMAGIPMVAAIGAPSSLAIELAQKQYITVVGFLKHDKCNVYCQSPHVEISI